MSTPTRCRVGVARLWVSSIRSSKHRRAELAIVQAGPVGGYRGQDWLPPPAADDGPDHQEEVQAGLDPTGSHQFISNLGDRVVTRPTEAGTSSDTAVVSLRAGETALARAATRRRRTTRTRRIRASPGPPAPPPAACSRRRPSGTPAQSSRTPALALPAVWPCGGPAMSRRSPVPHRSV